MARIVIESEFRKSKMADRSEMARNAIESEFRTSKMDAGSHFVKNCPKKIKVVYRSEMARNAIESEIRTSKMVAILSKKLKKKLRIDLKWPEMRSKVICGHPKWPPVAILSKKCVQK